MTTGFGAEPLKENGIIVEGTNAVDIRKIWGGLYTPGIISGGLITRSSSSLTYDISAGVAAIEWSDGQVVLAPIPETNDLPVPTNLTSGTDMIYAQQNNPAVEGNAKVLVKVIRQATGSHFELPPRSVKLGAYISQTGQGNTAAFVATGAIDFSIPYGASLGVLHQHRDTSNATFTGTATVGSTTIHVPTDRVLKVIITASLSAAGASGGFDNSGYAEAKYFPMLDGVRRAGWSTPLLTSAWSTYTFMDYMTIPRGTHTIAYQRVRTNGNPERRYSINDGCMGTLFSIEDVGPVV